MKGQGQLFWVKLVLGFVLIVMALSIGKSCAQLLIPTATESVTSFNNFVTVIENTENWASGTRQNVGLIMDKNSVIFGFAKGVASIDKRGGSIYQIIRTSACDSRESACICLCQNYVDKPNAADEPVINQISFSCESDSLLCRSLPASIDFSEAVVITKMVPSGSSITQSRFPRETFSLVGGFVIERPGSFPYWIFEDSRSQFMPEDGLFPRRFSVSIEKTDDNKVAVCARTPCAEPTPKKPLNPTQIS